MPRKAHPDYRSGLAEAISFFLPEGVFALGRLHGNAVWTPSSLAWAALLIGWGAETALCDRFRSAVEALAGLRPGLPIGGTYQGFVKAMRVWSERLLAAIAGRLRAVMQEIAGERWTREGRLAIAVDGTRVEAPRTAANEAGLGVPGRAGSAPQMAVTVLWHMGLGVPWDFRVGRGHVAERAQLREMIPGLPRGALLVADAGFAGYRLLSELRARGCSFLLRAGANVRLLRKLGWDVAECGHTVYLWPAGLRGKLPPLMLRRIEVKLGRRRACLLTDVLDESQLTDGQALNLYRLRWGVEVFHRSFKQTLQRRTMRCGEPRNARSELCWALTSLWLLGLAGAKEMLAAGRDPLALSCAAALRAARWAAAGRLRGESFVERMADAVKDGYARGRKTRKTWPRKKRSAPPGLPRIRTAGARERRQAAAFRDLRPAI